MLKNVLKTITTLIVFLFIINNTLYANEVNNNPKNIFISKCENSTKEIGLLDGFQDKSFILEISDFGDGHITFKMTLYNNRDCKSSWLNKLEYFEIKNYILLTEKLESLKSNKDIYMPNSTLWTPNGKIMELSTTSEMVAKQLIVPKKCGNIKSTGEVIIINENCMNHDDFLQFKKKRDFFPGTFLSLKYDKKQNGLLLFQNEEKNSHKNRNKYIWLFSTSASGT
ncbi:MAG: hypothetical protein ACI8ZF_000942 [Candidatus Midichloriaceae bacterium]|jgi:hypothetical protein